MLRRITLKMDPLKRILKPDSSVPPLPYGQIFDSPWMKQMRNLSLEIEEKKKEQNQTKAAKGIENNPYYSKYADRIKQKQLEEASKPASEKVTAKKEECQAKPEPESSKQQGSKPENLTKEAEKTTSMLKPKSKKSLNDIVKLELLEDKSAEEISEIWAKYHSSRDCIYATIPKNVYQEFYANIKQYPMFILPLPRNNAQTDESQKGDSENKECYEFYFLQSQEHAIYFTSLSSIQLHKEMAPVTLSMYHYPELSEYKGIVLMMGEYDTNQLSALEVQCLANQLQYYYTTKDSASKLSLHLFNKEPKSFDYMRLISHLEEGLLSQGIGSVNLKAQD